MTLQTNVESRYGEQYLVNLSNPADPSATTIGAALAVACTDCEADFVIYAGVTYDENAATNPLAAQHVSVAVEGVVAKLAIRTGTGGNYARTAHDDYVARLRDLALVAGRDRISPRTDSVLTPTSERVGDEVVRPAFDWPRFNDFIPDDPPDGGR
jgi:hypothetical protein